jgi:hypothetical protein
MHIESVAMLFFGVREQRQNEWHDLNWAGEDEIPCQALAEKLDITWQEFSEDGKKYRCIGAYCISAHSSKSFEIANIPEISSRWYENIIKYTIAIGVELTSDPPAWHLVTWVV